MKKIYTSFQGILLISFCLINFNIVAQAQINQVVINHLQKSFVLAIGKEPIMISQQEMDANGDYEKAKNFNNELKYREALSSLSAAMMIDSTGNCGTGIDGSAYVEMGYTYARLGLTDSAIICLDKAITLNKTFPKAYINKVMIFVGKKEYAAALSTLDELIAQNSRFLSAIALRGIISSMAGDRDMALAYLKQFLYQSSKSEDPQDKEFVDEMNKQLHELEQRK